MKVSIITATYNSASTVEDTLLSVQEQEHKDIEHILIDGGSKDDTMDILHRHEDHISYMASEPDKGIYDAMNKGLVKATGDIIAILNSDDIYEDKHVISDVLEMFDKQPIDTLYGDLLYVDEKDLTRVKRYWKSGHYYRNAFLSGWMPPHPTFFVKREVYERFGKFDLSFKTSADYEFMLRALYRNHCSSAHIDRVLVRMREGGQSNANTLTRILANQEDRRAWTKNGLSPKFYTLSLKPLRKLSQYFNRP